jgi:hypothetical protein
MMNSHGNLILLIRSNAWAAAVRRQKWPLRIRWAISLDDLLTEASRQPGSTAVIEFTGNPSVRQFEELAQVTNTPYHLNWLAVGDHSLERWRRILISLGFSDVFWSTTQASRLGELAHRHGLNSVAPTESLEQRIRAELPWKPVSARP